MRAVAHPAPRTGRLGSSARRLTLVAGVAGAFAGAMLLQSCATPTGPQVGSSGRITVTVIDDETDQPTPARIRLTDSTGEPVAAPETALATMWGMNDVAQGFASLPNGAFYSNGTFDTDLPDGTYQLSISKGYEYVAQQHELILESGDRLTPTYRLSRWIDMASRGWISGDDHIHLRRSPRENPVILGWIAAEDIQVGNLLQMGDFWATYYSQYAWGQDGMYQVEDRMLVAGQEEPRTHERGHTISLAADDFVRLPEQYYYYDRLFDQIHDLGGMTGYAHQAVTFAGYRGMTLDVLRDKIDFLELLQFCAEDGPLHTEHYYHFLNLGFELTATAGSDFPWCGRAPASANSRIGDARFYTYVGDEFTFETWREAVRDGHTFVTSGPIVELTVNGARPGDRLDVARGSTVSITARASGQADQIPLADLEIVAHGRVLQAATSSDVGQSVEGIELTVTLPVEHGMWIAARTTAGPTQVAHTTPVYVTVEGSGFHDPETLDRYLDLSGQYLDELQTEIAQPNDSLDRHAWRYREGLEEQIAETRGVIARLRQELGTAP